MPAPDIVHAAAALLRQTRARGHVVMAGIFGALVHGVEPAGDACRQRHAGHEGQSAGAERPDAASAGWRACRPRGP